MIRAAVTKQRRRGRTACGAVFELTPRAGRIAPRRRHDPPCTRSAAGMHNQVGTGIAMCLMLYLGTGSPLALQADADLRVEPVEKGRGAVRQWFSQPHIHFIGAHTGCSCGFPHVVAETPIEWFEGMFGDEAERLDDLRSVGALIQLVTRVLQVDGGAELYPVWNGEEGYAPKGTIELNVGSLVAQRFFLNERFMHAVVADRTAPGCST